MSVPEARKPSAVRLRVAGLQPAQVFAGIVSVLFLVAGIVGFTRTGFGDFAGSPHSTLLGFAINPFRDLVYVLTGLIGLLMAATSATARLFGWLTFAVYGVVLVWGLMLVGATATNPVDGLGNPLNLTIPVNWLHLVLAAVGLLIAVLPARRKVVITEPAPVVEEHHEPVPETRHAEDYRPAPVTHPAAPVTSERATVDPVTEPVPAQAAPVAATDETAEARPKKGLHRFGRHRTSH